MTPAKHALSTAEGTQSTLSSEKPQNIFSLRAWRLGAKKFSYSGFVKHVKQKKLVLRYEIALTYHAANGLPV